MRTTIEMDPEHRAKLLEIAARRGEKGFSGIVTEAIDAYLKLECDREGLRRKALLARGSLGRDEAEELRREVASLRGMWR